jgi:hypothetical protein
VNLYVLVDAEDKAKIKQRAASVNLSMSEYIRQMALRGYVIQRNTKGIAELIHEINKIGVNINQIAKWCNEIQAVPLSALKDLQEEHGKVWQLLDDFMAAGEMFDFTQER